MRRISISLAWDPTHLDEFLALARAADEAGVETLWLSEGFGHDAFSGLALLARETQRAKLGTSVVNVYSRTPGALAQHFATIDELSGGRVIVGLGASGPGVIERFHGLPFEAPKARIRETIALLRAYWSKQRFDHPGPRFPVRRALVMGARPVQPSPPIYLATMHPGMVRMTAEQSEGWLPNWIPRDRLADRDRGRARLGGRRGTRPGGVHGARPGRRDGRRGCRAAGRVTRAVGVDAGLLRGAQRAALRASVRPAGAGRGGGGDPARLEGRWPGRGRRVWRRRSRPSSASAARSTTAWRGSRRRRRPGVDLHDVRVEGATASRRDGDPARPGRIALRRARRGLRLRLRLCMSIKWSASMQIGNREM